MIPSFLSPVALYSAYLRRCFSAAGLSSQTMRLDDGKGTVVHFWGPTPTPTTKKKNKKGVVVLIHGFGPTATWQWRSQVQHLASTYDVYVPDLVFFGESWTASEERSDEFQAAAVAAMMERVGAERYSVVGTSYGGMVGYKMAREWPERVEKVVIASSGVNMRRRDRESLVKAAGVSSIEELMLPETAGQLRKLLSLVLYNPPNSVFHLFFNDLLNKLYKENRKEKIELLRGLTIGQDDEPTLSPLLNKDVLLIWGDHDKIFPVEMAMELKQILGNKVKMEVIKESGHVPQIEKPAAFNKLVNNFLM